MLRPYQGFGEGETIPCNQLLPPNFFCQREGFAGEGLGFCPLLTVEGKCCQITCVIGDTLLLTNFLCNAQGFTVVALGGGVIFVFAFCFCQVVQHASDIITFRGNVAAYFQRLAEGNDGGGIIFS